MSRIMDQQLNRSINTYNTGREIKIQNNTDKYLDRLKRYGNS